MTYRSAISFPNFDLGPGVKQRAQNGLLQIQVMWLLIFISINESIVFWLQSMGSFFRYVISIHFSFLSFLLEFCYRIVLNGVQTSKISLWNIDFGQGCKKRTQNDCFLFKDIFCVRCQLQQLNFRFALYSRPSL